MVAHQATTQHPTQTNSAWALIDTQGRLLEVSSLFATAFQRNEAVLRGQLLHAYLHPEQVAFACEVSAMVRDGLTDVERAWLVQMPSGEYKGIHAEMTPEQHPTAGHCLRIELE